MSETKLEGDTEEAADVKVILLGDSAVGKTKLVERYLMNDYHPRQVNFFLLFKQLSTYALTLFRQKLNIDNKQVLVDFWDTAGQERFSSMHPSYYFGAHVCILVFDVTRKSTYKNLDNWYKELRNYCEQIPCIVVANKIDVDYEVTTKVFRFASEHGLPLFYASAADGTNVVKVFKEACLLGYQYKNSPNKDFYTSVMELLNDSVLDDVKLDG